MTVVCVFPRPKAHYRKSGELRPDAPVWYASAPDVDNCYKYVADALNGVFWRDDRQIAVGMVYAIYGAVPGTAVLIREPWMADWEAARCAVRVCGGEPKEPLGR